jgi:hypothetical protein
MRLLPFVKDHSPNRSRGQGNAEPNHLVDCTNGKVKLPLTMDQKDFGKSALSSDRTNTKSYSWPWTKASRSERSLLRVAPTVVTYTAGSSLTRE